MFFEYGHLLTRVTLSIDGDYLYFEVWFVTLFEKFRQELILEKLGKKSPWLWQIFPI